jgi:hypothetical protein
VRGSGSCWLWGAVGARGGRCNLLDLGGFWGRIRISAVSEIPCGTVEFSWWCITGEVVPETHGEVKGTISAFGTLMIENEKSDTAGTKYAHLILNKSFCSFTLIRNGNLLVAILSAAVLLTRMSLNSLAQSRKKRTGAFRATIFTKKISHYA